ncbi:hypothetical protein BX666DRAFT_1982124 [Dichotomocladium elegans]|nr:hypothetical protein BX666DRAFT_1982124 [Dichotomocladium elegans]
MADSIITTISPYDAHLRLLFIHGFLGQCDRTFKDFMKPLVTYMEREEQFKNVKIDYHCYDYETKGGYEDAPKEFVHHLEQLDHEWHSNDYDEQLPNFVIILAHSIGGLVVADAIKMLDRSPLLNHSKVIGLITFDTPFFSFDRTFFKMALDDLQQRPWDVVTKLVRARATPGSWSDIVTNRLERLKRHSWTGFPDHSEFFATLLCGMTSSTLSTMISDLFQPKSNAAGAGASDASVPRQAHIQFMAELLETMTHSER